ncbi:DUF5719 family protein [Spirillospora albida]|uniref:DUF5719 family protein n=1 Tax=Spirillospora albida TaxID=58123 RepID=UPI0004BEF73C|nr:DUF5719 family protein [Spirillospora albida]
MDRVIRLLGTRYAAAGLMVVAVAALYGAATFSRPDGRAAAVESRVPVTAAVLVCPGREDARIGVQTLEQDGRTGGRVDIAEIGGGAVGAMSGPGQAWARDVGAAAKAVAVRAGGTPAAGLAAEQSAHRPDGGDRGLAAVRCAAPGTDHWFLGHGPVAADAIDLHLTNVDAQPASVDLTALSGEGPLDTPDGRAVPIPPNTTKVIAIGESADGLGDIVDTAHDLALRVRATSGRVAASLRIRLGAGKGVDWVPLSPAPARSVLVPGVAGGSGERRLLVAVPGDADARIGIQVLTADGAFAPQGQDVLDAPAKTVTALDLHPALTGKVAAVRLTSDRPILAGYAARRGADVAYGAATPPLGDEGGGVIAANRFGSYLALTAPAGAATVRITGGQGAPQEIAIPAGRTIETRLTPPPGGEDGFPVTITPRPGSGPVHAARTMGTGKGADFRFTVLPVVPAPTTLRQPAVGDSQSVLIP